MGTGKRLIKGAVILTIAGVITRLLGFFYRIYMTNLFGSECIGLYQLIMPIYTLAWSISCAGFTTTISKLVAQERAKKNFCDIKKILTQCVSMSFLLGVILNLILYFGAESFAQIFLKDPRIILSLKILAFSFPFMAIGSCMRGYFFGIQDSVVPAVSQVLEQCVHMLIIFIFINQISHREITHTCALAVSGILAGEFFSCLYTYLIYNKKKIKTKSLKQNSRSNLDLFNLIMSITIPLTANKVTASFLVTLENILIPKRLLLNGFSYANAISTYGKITGMAMPLIYFPSVFLVSLSISLVPEVSQAYAIKNKNQISNTVSKTILFTSIIGMCAAIFFIIFSREIGVILYHEDISHMLILLGLMCPFLYLQIILSGILNGMSYQFFVFKINLLSSLINLFFIYFFIPYKGITAFILGWFISLIISCLLSLNIITKSINIKLKFTELILKPCLAMLATGLTTRLIANKLIFLNHKNIFGLFTCALILASLYFIFIISLGCVSLKEIKYFAKPKRIN